MAKSMPIDALHPSSSAKPPKSESMNLNTQLWTLNARKVRPNIFRFLKMARNGEIDAHRRSTPFILIPTSEIRDRKP